MAVVVMSSFRAVKLPAPAYYADLLAGRVQLLVNADLIPQATEEQAMAGPQKIPLKREGLFFL